MPPLTFNNRLKKIAIAAMYLIVHLNDAKASVTGN